VAYKQIGWCQYRKNNNSIAIENAQKAIELSPKDESNYNLLAGIYSIEGNKELAIENYKKAIEMTLSENEKVCFMSNLSTAYMDLFKYNEARDQLNQALFIDSTYTHAWWQNGILYNKENKIDSAIITFHKAISLNPMQDFLQKQLFFDLANSEFRKAKYMQNNISGREKLLIEAKTHLLKALDFEHDNNDYKNLLNEINSLN